MSEFTQDTHDRSEIWKRGIFMVLFVVLYGVAELVVTVVVVVQFLCVLVTGSANEQLLRLGSSLACYSYEVFSYLTFNSERKPFPLNDWPKDETNDSPWYEPSDPSYSQGLDTARANASAGRNDEATSGQHDDRTS